MSTHFLLKKSDKDQLQGFEDFLYNIGFKRNEGAVFGLLVLCNDSLSSEQIETELGLSQSSVSQVLKNLTHYGAVITSENRSSDKKIKLHTVKEDSLSIVATVFKKREQENIDAFKTFSESLLSSEKEMSSPRAKRLKSIITTCELAQSVMNFVIKVSAKKKSSHYEDIVAKVPGALDLITSTVDPLTNIAQGLKENITKGGSALFSHKLTEGLMKFTGENYDSKK